ncbi:MAG: hypothetical protein LBH97_02095 [Treponema sp.]|jgi:electron transport complex protein RnfA|nr:hypothetical protein [Treponema sp.]
MNLPALYLMVFSGLSLNLILQCGLGMRGAALIKSSDNRLLFIKLGLIFITIFLLWGFFSLISLIFDLGFFEYILLFPASAFVFFSLEYILFNFILKEKIDNISPINWCDGLAGAALFITLNIAEGFLDAISLSFGFVTGIFLSFIIISEIRRRAAMEQVPPFLRGSPLALISMGLLSLIFSFAAVMFLRVLGAE